jgi:hypothetical protein
VNSENFPSPHRALYWAFVLPGGDFCPIVATLLLLLDCRVGLRFLAFWELTASPTEARVLAVLSNPTYRRLFTAQVVALTGTGLATVALGLLAYDLAGADAAAVLGTALAIKMVAYVCVAPIAGVLAARLSRRTLLVSLDVVRGCMALALPWVDQVWQV